MPSAAEDETPLGVGEMRVKLHRDGSRQQKGQSFPGLFLLKMAGNPQHAEGITVAELRPSSAKDERKKVRVGDAITRINGVVPADLGSLAEIKEYVKTQKELVLVVKRRVVRIRARTIRREARRHVEGALFQQPQLAAALSTVPTLMPASWYDTLEVRVHTLTLLATAASAGSLDLPTPGATGSILEDIDAIWKTSGSAPGVGASDGGCVDAMRSVHLHLHMLASGDSHTTDGIKPLFQPKGPVVCSFKLIRLRVAPLGDTLRISLMQRSGLHLRSQALASIELRISVDVMGEKRIIDAPNLQLLLPRTDDPLGSLHISARHITTSTIGKEAASRRVQALARTIIMRTQYLHLRRLICAIQAIWRGVLSRRRARLLKQAGAAEAVTRIQALTRGSSSRGMRRIAMRQLLSDLLPLERRLLYLPLVYRGSVGETNPRFDSLQWRATLDLEERVLAFRLPPSYEMLAWLFGRDVGGRRRADPSFGSASGQQAGSTGSLAGDESLRTTMSEVTGALSAVGRCSSSVSWAPEHYSPLHSPIKSSMPPPPPPPPLVLPPVKRARAPPPPILTPDHSGEDLATCTSPTMVSMTMGHVEEAVEQSRGTCSTTPATRSMPTPVDAASPAPSPSARVAARSSLLDVTAPTAVRGAPLLAHTAARSPRESGDAPPTAAAESSKPKALSHVSQFPQRLLSANSEVIPSGSAVSTASAPCESSTYTGGDCAAPLISASCSSSAAHAPAMGTADGRAAPAAAASCSSAAGHALEPEIPDGCAASAAFMDGPSAVTRESVPRTPDTCAAFTSAASRSGVVTHLPARHTSGGYAAPETTASSSVAFAEAPPPQLASKAATHKLADETVKLLRANLDDDPMLHSRKRANRPPSLLTRLRAQMLWEHASRRWAHGGGPRSRRSSRHSYTFSRDRPPPSTPKVPPFSPSVTGGTPLSPVLSPRRESLPPKVQPFRLSNDKPTIATPGAPRPPVRLEAITKVEITSFWDAEFVLTHCGSTAATNGPRTSVESLIFRAASTAAMCAWVSLLTEMLEVRSTTERMRRLHAVRAAGGLGESMGSALPQRRSAVGAKGMQLAELKRGVRQVGGGLSRIRRAL